jgi:uncharacterized membrane protein (UPF0127 family)
LVGTATISSYKPARNAYSIADAGGVKSYKVKSIIQIILIAFLILFLFNITYKPSLKDIKYVNIAGQKVKVELALSVLERMQGLSGRQNLDEGTGMLFVFEKLGVYPFWMKDMNFSIDIIWLGQDQKIVYIKKNASPESYPEVFDPQVDAMYILEVPAGFGDKNNLKVGDRVEFEF